MNTREYIDFMNNHANMSKWPELDLNKTVRPEVLRWCKNNTVNKVYEDNAYDIKHFCENDLNTYVTATEVAMAYSLLEHRVEQTDFSIYKIYG